MPIHELLIILLISAVAGILAGLLAGGQGYGIIVDILIGLAGGYLGYWIFKDRLDITHNALLNNIITATAGATILTVILRIIRGRRDD
jgi:uncharacterized membrane protein YeaQ/YmgE (transglycosylase-associated protein family)